MFIQHGSFAKPRVDKPMGLQRGHIDLATLSLTFIYYELVFDGEIWVNTERQQVLVMNTHFEIDKRKGVIRLIDHPFWHTPGRWRAGDRPEEELLYKGTDVKHPQRIDFAYEHYTPEMVEIMGEKDMPTGLTPVRKSDTSLASVDMDEFDTEAKDRLGYDMLKHGVFSGSYDNTLSPFDWEK